MQALSWDDSGHSYVWNPFSCSSLFRPPPSRTQLRWGYPLLPFPPHPPPTPTESQRLSVFWRFLTGGLASHQRKPYPNFMFGHRFASADISFACTSAFSSSAGVRCDPHAPLANRRRRRYLVSFYGVQFKPPKYYANGRQPATRHRLSPSNTADSFVCWVIGPPSSGNAISSADLVLTVPNRPAPDVIEPATRLLGVRRPHAPSDATTSAALLDGHFSWTIELHESARCCTRDNRAREQQNRTGPRRRLFTPPTRFCFVCLFSSFLLLFLHFFFLLLPLQL